MLSNNLKQISNFKNNELVYCFLFCNKKEKAKKKNGQFYINLQLSDSTGSINAKIWNNIDYFGTVFKEEDLLAVKGIIKTYLDELYIDISSVHKIEKNYYDEYGFSSKKIIKKISKKSFKLNKILKTINELEPFYRKFVIEIYMNNINQISNFSNFNHENILIKGIQIDRIYYGLKIYHSIHETYTNINDSLLKSILILYPIFQIENYIFANNEKTFKEILDAINLIKTANFIDLKLIEQIEYRIAILIDKLNKV